MKDVAEKNRDILIQGFGLERGLLEVADEIQSEVHRSQERILGIASYNQARVLRAFRNHRVSDSHFAGTTGYGYHDEGRDVLERVAAEILAGEEALYRPHFASGTHAISCVLFGILRPGDVLLAATGPPYDTLVPVIGARHPVQGSLADWGIGYKEASFPESKNLDPDRIASLLTPETRVAFVQRSCGYSQRRSLSISQIRALSEALHKARPDLIVFVDNCYGEFVEIEEPLEAGADIVAGSLIKNPGGTLAPTGGYVAGRASLVKLAASRLTAPGIGEKVGATPGNLRSLFQGLFMAPTLIKESLLGMEFASAIFKRLGFPVKPEPGDVRADIIQEISLGSRAALLAFCNGFQRASPVYSHAIPEPALTPGYGDEIIMAGGTFVQGSSSELSADAPLREPYSVFLQGGFSSHHTQIAVLCGVQELIREGHIPALFSCRD
ncbi:MAG: methionine gamma-lyase family protein [Armatimonadetes bacterium]|nr:methionine gamma-lyase family protein [Armatimonadota bacterium]